MLSWAAITDLQAFIDFGERIEPVPDPVRTIDGARSRIEGIRRRMAGNQAGGSSDRTAEKSWSPVPLPH